MARTVAEQSRRDSGTAARQNRRTAKRQVSREARQRAHPGRTPVILTCKSCAHSWESFGGEGSLIRCPECGKGQRLHRKPAASSQVTAIADAPPVPRPAQDRRDAGRGKADADTGRNIRPGLDTGNVIPPDMYLDTPYPLPDYASYPADDYDDYEIDDEPDDNEPAPGELEKAVSAAIMKAHEGKRQEIIAHVSVIQRIDRILRGTETAFPFIRHKIVPVSLDMMNKVRLILWIDQAAFEASMQRIGNHQATGQDAPLIDTLRESETLLPAAREILRRKKKPSRFASPEGARCQWPQCSAIAGYSTRNLYRITSPALGRPVILCELHAASELTVPGARAAVIR
jgi:hypothetical protein